MADGTQDVNALDYLANGRSFDTQSDEDRKEGTRIVQEWGRLETAAVNWKTHWQEIYENIVPRKEDVVATRMPGDRRNSDLYDTTAILANEMLASALHGMLTNPETRFFELTFGDPKLDDDEAVRNWCQDTGDRMFRVLNNTNFQTEIYEIYIDLGSIGTACLFMGEHDDNVVHFSARAMKEIRIDENNIGMIDVVYRTFKWRAFQIIEQFGEDACPTDVVRAAAKNSQDQYEVLHAVEPMSRAKAKDNAKGHKFKSTYVMKDSKYILSKDGFREFPYAVPRWSKTTGEIYGRGPGMSMLPDILMVNAMMLTVIQGAQMTTNPPLMVEDDGVIGQIRLTPGGLTIVRPGESDKIKPLITNAQIDFGQKCVEDVRSRIRAGFYIDQLQMQQGPQKTAEEVRQSTEDKLRLMGPVLGRQHFEFLKPVITRLFDIMLRKDLIPPPPDVIKGRDFDVRYSSMIARAQRINEGQNIARAMAMLQPLVQLKPEILDILDTDALVREVWGIYNNPHDLLVTKQALAKLKAQRQQAAQQQAQQQQQESQSNVLKNATPAIVASQANQQGGPPGVPQS